MEYRFTYKNYAEVLYEALRKDPFYIAMEASVSKTKQGKQAMLMYLDFSMVEAQKYGELLLANQEHYGASIWSKPLNESINKQSKKLKQSFICDCMGEKSLMTYKSITATMSMHANTLVTSDAWYLSIIGVLPEFQGQGLGIKLINPILEKLDEQSVSTYLETFSSANLSFYERLGYRIAATLYEPTVEAEYRLMIRDGLSV